MRHFSSVDFQPSAKGVASSTGGEPAAPRRSRLVPWLVVGGLLPIVAIALSTAVLVSNFRDRDLADSERELRNTALILAEQTDRSFQAVRLVESGLIERMRSSGITTRDEYMRQMSGYDTHLLLRDTISGLPHIDALSLFDAEGTLVNFSRRWPLPAINVADRNYFVALASNAGTMSFISEPITSRGSGKAIIVLAHKFTLPNGEFLGVLVGAMELDNFEKSFGAISLGERSSISLYRSDGMLLTRHPYIDAAIGQIDTGFLEALRHSVGGAFTTIGKADQPDRFVVSQPLEHFPLLISVGDDISSMLAAWQQETNLLLVTGGLAVVVVGIVIFLIAYELVRRTTESRQEARAAHERLRDAFEVVPEGVALFDAEDRFVLWNSRYKEIYAGSADTIRVGIRFEDVLRAGLARGQYVEAQGREEAWLAERLACHAAEQSTHEQELAGNRWLRVHERRTADGGSIGIRIDITELKQREASFRLLFDGNPVPMYVFDVESLRFIAVNDTAVSYYGYSREQFLQMTVLDIRPPEDRGGFLTAFRTFADYRAGAQSRHQKADGTIIDAEIYSRMLSYDGRPARFAAAIDVTEQRRAERERDRDRAFLDQIIDNVPAGIVVKEVREGRYVLMNRAAERLWGMRRADTIGKTASELFADRAAEILALDQEALRSAGPVYIGAHRRVIEGDESRIVTSTRVAIRGPDEQPLYLVSVLEDVTDRKEVEQQLQQAQKMEAVGNLTGGLAHDFNNLLTIIIGNLDLLQGDVAGNEDAELKVETILQASVRGADLTRQMLAFSRRQPLHPKRVDVSKLAYETTRMLKRTLGENVRIDLRMAADTWPVLVDEAQLEAALVNMAINARDAMADGGTLTIETSKLHLDAERPVVVGAVEPGDYMVIAMRDTGTGMPPKVVARVFEPFFTTKAAGLGTGLGLSMVYGFVKQSGGQIGIDSEVGNGTTFTLYLPRAAAQEAESDVKQSSERRATPMANGEVVLAVDDNSGVRATVVTQLEELGYHVLEADGGASALEILQGPQDIDLLFTDIVMPGGLNGKELATQARTLRPGLKVLFTSGYPGAEQSSTTELDHGDVLLSKPYRRYDLARAVHDMLAE